MVSLGKALSRPPVTAMACLIFAAFLIFAFPAMGSLMNAHTPSGGAFDTAFFYSPAEAASKAALYSDADRAAMAKIHWTYDLAFPLSYGFCLTALWALGLRLLSRPGTPPRYGLLWLPLAGALFDVAENASITAVLSADSALLSVAAVAASACTLIKWLLIIPAFLGAVCLPVAGLIAIVIRRA